MYIFKVFRLESIGTLLKVSKKINTKTNIKQLKIMIDMIKCSLKYQASFYDYLEFEFYLLNELQRQTYLTRGKNDEIIKKYNDKNYFNLLDNKLEFNSYFNKFIKRDYLDLNKASLKEFREFTFNKKSIISKPINGEGGKGIRIIELYDIEQNKLFDELIYNKEYLVEEVIKQHDELNKLYDKSVNCLRMFTFCKDNKVYFLQAILKIGNNSFVDNFSSGGVYAFLDEEGKVITQAIDQNDNIYKVHPITNYPIIGFQVPYFKESINLIKEAALLIPQIGYIGWDVAITNEGPLIIEGNSYPGIFQIKASFGNKTGLVPKYEDIMEIKFK